MSGLVGNPRDRFSHNEAHIIPLLGHCIATCNGMSQYLVKLIKLETSRRHGDTVT